MAGHKVLIGDRIVEFLKRTRTPRAAADMAAVFGVSRSRIAERLADLERRGLVKRAGLSDSPGDITGSPKWAICEVAP